MSADPGTTAITATAAELNLVDGDATVGTTAVAAMDGFLHNDNGTMRVTAIGVIADLFAGTGLESDTGVLNIDVDSLTELSAAPATGDMFLFSDGGTEKKVSMANVAGATFGIITGDVTITALGAAVIAADAVHATMLNDDVISGQTELAAGDIANADEMMISDGGTLKKVGVDSLATFIGDNLSVNVQNVAAAGTLQVGVNYFSDMGSDGEDVVTLPASPSVGQSVKVKAPSDCSDARYITINSAGSQTIDGATGIRLESPFAAVELVYVANDLWRVF